MDKTQEEKFEKFYAEDPLAVSGIKENQRIGWSACLEANGIGGDYSNPPNKPCGHDVDKPCECELHREDPRIPEGYFKIGEKVEARDRTHKWVRGKIGLGCGVFLDDATTEVRRIPAWVPKEGESVLFENCVFKSAVGVYVKGSIYLGRTKQDASKMKLKQFDGDESKIGKPWSEI